MIYAIAFIVLQGWPSTQACSSTLAALFTPARPQLGRYEACTEPASIEAIVAAGKADRLHYSNIELVDPLDAFGTAGSYDRSRVVRLYGGSRPQVARGWRQDGDRFESITLISPHPDESLTRLVRGTLVIRWII